MTTGTHPAPASSVPRQLSILFVDDEQRLIDALQRMLRPQRREWEMEFTGSGEQALRRLGERTYDVIVCDLRMPGVSGLEVLAEAARRSPATVRIVLSGHADGSAMRQAMGLAHQYLSKPCDADLLRSVIGRACRLRALLADDRLRSLAGRLRVMPSLPTLYLRLVDLLRDPQVPLRAVSDLVAQDLGMSVKVLQLVNSAFFGLSRQQSDPHEAVALIGIDTLQALVLSSHAFSELDAGVRRIADADALWARCLQVGQVAKRIAMAENAARPIADEAFMAGMLHKVGELMLAERFGEEWTAVRRLAAVDPDRAEQIERSCFGASHAELGAYLLGLWGLADPIVEAVAFHRHPSACSGRGFTALSAVHAAQALVEADARRVPALDREYLARIGVLKRVPAWCAIHAAVVEGSAP